MGILFLDDMEAKGFHFDQLKGQLHLAHDEIRLSRAELRRDTGRVAGDVLYRPAEQTMEFNLTVPESRWNNSPRCRKPHAYCRRT